MATEELIQQMLLNAPDPNERLPVSNREETIYGATVPFLVLSWVAVGLRMWVRLRRIREPGWDDFFVVLAASLNTVATILVLISIKYGLGHHFLYLGVPKMTTYIKLFYFENAIYITQTAVIKISLLLQYLRIFKAGNMRWICMSLLILISAWGITYGFMAWVPCFPPKAYWLRHDYPYAKCYGFGFADPKDFTALFESHTALNMVFDITIFLTPMVLFSKPNLRKKNLLAMAGIFILGAIVVLTSVWRLYSIVASRAATYPYVDFTWWPPISIILSCLEIDLAIMCASMPIFWPVIEKSLSAIFVTQEVTVVAEDRGLAYELERRGDLHRQASVKSDSANSRESLTRKATTEGLNDHYNDHYVLAHVDPLATDSIMGMGGGVETNVDSTRQASPKWRI